jgi:ABC-type iron transport system FetAB ATPase subunit
MPMAYQSLIGDMGAALSAGQRQRIMLARALYRDPDALFLDEGTANLDEENEAAIADLDRQACRSPASSSRTARRWTDVDMRSLSRVGASDVGKNAERIREFLADLQRG